MFACPCLYTDELSDELSSTNRANIICSRLKTSRYVYRILINRRVTRVGTFEVCVPTHVALGMFIMQVRVSQLHFQANRNAEPAIPPLFWPVNCIKIGGHVALLSDPTVYSLCCGVTAVGGTCD